MEGVQPSSWTPPCFTLRAAGTGGSFFSGRAWLPRRVRLPARGKTMQARLRPSSSPATRSQPLSCDFLPDQPIDVGRNGEGVDVLGRVVQEGQACIDIGAGIGPQALAVERR